MAGVAAGALGFGAGAVVVVVVVVLAAIGEPTDASELGFAT
jgi:hypothetical protein